MRRALILLSVILAVLVRAPVEAASMGATATAVVTSAYEGILAHAGEDRMWIARVVASSDTSQTHTVRTEILVRALDQPAGKQDWKAFATVPARVTALASRGTELAVLLEDQSWMRIWSAEGAAGGAPLPAGGQMRTLANDSSGLWAIGSVRGGLFAAMAAVKASDAAGSATQPATEPAPEAETNHDGPLPYKLVLFREHQASWIPVADLPADLLIPTAAPIGLAVVGSDAVISYQIGTGSVRTLRFGDNFHWQDIGLVHAPDPAGQISDFALLAVDQRPMLWIAQTRSGADARVEPVRPGGDARWAGWLALPAEDAAPKPVMLQWKGDALPQMAPALAVGDGALRLFALHDERIYEQAYSVTGVSTASGKSPATLGAPLGPAAQVMIPVDPESGPVQYAINVALLVALAFSVLATMYRRRALLRRRRARKDADADADADSDDSSPAVLAPPPAPLIPRLVAGLIDLLPVLGCSAVLTVRRDAAMDPLQQLSSGVTLIAICSAAAFYLLHTTLSELLAGRTLGKWAMGLRPVTLGGGRPSAVQMLLRNLLRIIDLLWFPLVLVLLSPLRQRSADVAAGTMVVREGDAAARAPSPTEDVGKDQ